MIRDLFTVPFGEQVTIYLGPSIYGTGTFAGYMNDHIIIDSPRLGLFPVRLDDAAFDVLDHFGNCLGLLVPDPDLRGAVPELE